MATPNATINIDVSLDTTANPAVELTKMSGGSARSQKASTGNTIKWQKKDNTDNFDITKLEPTGPGTAFGTATTGGNGQWLKSDYQPTSTGPNDEFPYTLTVTKDGVPYDTTESPELTDDKPVIRN